MKKYAFYLSLAAIPFIIGCGGGGSSDTTASAVTISGTVPGTLIEAFCENGSYVRVTSNNNGTAEHPFSISVPQGINCRLVMTTNENDPENRVITPIGFINNGTQGVTISLNKHIDMGYVPLAMNPGDIYDANRDHVSDDPHYHDLGDIPDIHVSDIPVLDSDKDGIVDPYEDNNRNRVVNAYEDDDHDGTPNMYDDDDGNEHPDYLEDDDHDGKVNHMDDDDGNNRPDYTEDDDHDGTPNHIDDNNDNNSENRHDNGNNDNTDNYHDGDGNDNEGPDDNDK
jgi:hypothetical protein